MECVIASLSTYVHLALTPNRTNEGVKSQWNTQYHDKLWCIVTCLAIFRLCTCSLVRWLLGWKEGEYEGLGSCSTLSTLLTGLLLLHPLKKGPTTMLADAIMSKYSARSCRGSNSRRGTSAHSSVSVLTRIRTHDLLLAIARYSASLCYCWPIYRPTAVILLMTSTLDCQKL